MPQWYFYLCRMLVVSNINLLFQL